MIVKLSILTGLATLFGAGMAHSMVILPTRANFGLLASRQASMASSVNMSWPESAGFLKIMPMTPNLSGEFQSDQWGVLFGPTFKPMVAPAPLAGTAPTVAAPPAVTATAGSPATGSGSPTYLGPAIPGSMPTEPGKKTTSTAGNKNDVKPGQWVEDKSSKDSKVKVTVESGGPTDSGQATTGTVSASTPIQAGTGVPNAAPAAPQAQVAPTSERIQGAYIGWTPGKIYAAGLVPQGADMVVSLDAKATGQAFGTTDSDFEFRFSSTGQPGSAKQVIEGSLQPIPAWAPMLKETVTPAPNMPGWSIVEAEMTDPTDGYFPQKVGGQFSIRVDAVPTGVDTPKTGVRALSLVETADSKGPNGLASDVGTMYPGLIFTGVNQFTSGITSDLILKPKITWPNFAKVISIKALGADSANLTSVQYQYGNALAGSASDVPYRVLVGKDIDQGYGAFAVNISDGMNPGVDYYLPYRVVGPITIQSHAQVIHSTSMIQKVKIQATLISNVKQSIRGMFSVVLPQGWTADKGTDKSFVLYNINNKSGADFVLSVPKGAAPGLYPITMTVKYDQAEVSKVTYVLIL